MKNLKLILYSVLLFIANIVSNSFLERLSTISAPVEHDDMYLNKRDLINESGERRHEALLGDLARSKIMRELEDQRSVHEVVINLPLASAEKQKKFKEIANELGVDPKRFQLKAFSEDFDNGRGKKKAGFYEPGIIAVKEGVVGNNLDFIMRHELQHAIHNDRSGIFFTLSALMISGPVTTGLLFKRLATVSNIEKNVNFLQRYLPKPLVATVMPVAAIVGGLFVGADSINKYYGKLKETRADRRAAYSYGSAKKLLDYMPTYGAYQKNDAGYLGVRDYFDIAHHLIDQGKGDGITHEMVEERESLYINSDRIGFEFGLNQLNYIIAKKNHHGYNTDQLMEEREKILKKLAAIPEKKALKYY